MLFCAVILLAVCDAVLWSNKTDRVSVYIPQLHRIIERTVDGVRRLSREKDKQILYGGQAATICFRYNKVNPLRFVHTHHEIYFKEPGMWHLRRKARKLYSAKVDKAEAELPEFVKDLSTAYNNRYTVEQLSQQVYNHMMEELDEGNEDEAAELRYRLDLLRNHYNMHHQAKECRDYFKDKVDAITGKKVRHTVFLSQFMIPSSLGSNYLDQERLYDMYIGYQGIWRFLTLDRMFAKVQAAASKYTKEVSIRPAFAIFSDKVYAQERDRYSLELKQKQEQRRQQRERQSQNPR